MRLDPDAIESSCPGDEAVAVLASEVRRLQAVIASTADQQAHTDWLRHAFADQTIRAVRAEAESARLCEAIRRLVDQDATLAVQGGNVTVTMDGITDRERVAINWAIATLETGEPDAGQNAEAAAILSGMLARDADTTPSAHTTACKCSVQSEGTAMHLLQASVLNFLNAGYTISISTDDESKLHLTDSERVT